MWHASCKSLHPRSLQSLEKFPCCRMSKTNSTCSRQRMCVVGIQLTFSCTRFFDYERKTRYITGNHLKTIVIPSPNAWSEDYRTNARFRKPTRLSSAQPFFSHFPSLISQCSYSLPAYPCVYFLVLTTHVRIPRLPPPTRSPLSIPPFTNLSSGEWRHLCPWRHRYPWRHPC